MTMVRLGLVVQAVTTCLAGGSNGNTCTALSRPIQRKLVALVSCQLVEEEGRARAVRAARSLGERTVTEMILQHQNSQQLSANLWAAVRARGCQFLGPGENSKRTRLKDCLSEGSCQREKKNNSKRNKIVLCSNAGRGVEAHSSGAGGWFRLVA